MTAQKQDYPLLFITLMQIAIGRYLVKPEAAKKTNLWTLSENKKCK